MLASKRSIADFNREENNRIKELRTIKHAKQWDTNRVFYQSFRVEFLRSKIAEKYAKISATSSINDKAPCLSAITKQG